MTTATARTTKKLAWLLEAIEIKSSTKTQKQTTKTNQETTEKVTEKKIEDQIIGKDLIDCQSKRDPSRF